MRQISIFNLLESFVNLLIPKKSYYHGKIDTYLSEDLINQARLRYRKPDLQAPHYLEKVFFCLDYTPEVQNLLHRAKFEGEFAIIKDLTNLVYHVLSQNLQSQKPKVTFKDSILTFVPEDQQRKAMRGYHLPALFAAQLASQLQIPYQHLFLKTRSTLAQSLLSREARIANIQDAFELKNHLPTNLQRVYILDDLVTTGSTLNQTAKALKNFYPQIAIYGLTIASA